MSIEQVEPILGHSVRIGNRDLLPEFVELPLLSACQRFYDLNIRTIQSSANVHDWYNRKSGFITLDFDFLSPQNQEIARQLGEILDEGYRVAVLWFSLPQDGSAKTLSEEALKVANRFLPQSLGWSSASLEELRERLENPHLTESDLLDRGYAFDEATGRYFISEEHLEKEEAFRRGKIYIPGGES